MVQNWTWFDFDTIRKNYPVMGSKITELMPGRTCENIAAKAFKLNTPSTNSFTNYERSLIDTYKDKLGVGCLFLMPDHTIYEIEDFLSCGEK